MHSGLEFTMERSAKVRRTKYLLMDSSPPYGLMETILFFQGPVAGSLVSANRWLRSIRTYTFPWYLTPVSANHASSNPGQICPGLT